MTLTQLRASVAAELGLDNTASSAEQALMDRWIQDGVHEVLKQTRVYTDHKALTLSAETEAGDYRVTSAVLKILDLYVDSAADPDKPLDRKTADEVLQLRRANIATDAPYWYAFEGHDLLMLAPAPASAPTVKALFVPKPTALSAGGDDPSTAAKGGIPTHYHDAIEFWAYYRGASMDGVAAKREGQTYLEWFNARIARIRRDVREHGGRNMGPITVGYPSRGVPRRKDVYPER